MSLLLKIVGYTFGGLAVVLAIAATIAHVSSNARLSKTFVVSPRPVSIPNDAEAMAQGRHLAETRGCNDCHGKDYAGGKVIEDGGMGRIHAPNLTRGQGGRIAAFNDADWVRAIRHGVGPDQHGLLVMPSEEYSHFSDEDLGALIAYLKTVPAVDRVRPATALGPVAKVLLATGNLKLAAESIDHANLRPPSIAPSISAEYGRYVAASCTGCHGANFAGGKIKVGPPNWPAAANLTPHESGRLARWTEADFIKTLRTAKRPDGTEVDPVMPRVFGEMNDVELKALWTFFRTLPPAPTGAQ